MNTTKKQLWSQETILYSERLRLEPLQLRHLDSLEKNLLKNPHAWHSVHWGQSTRADIERGILNSFDVRKKELGNSFAFVMTSTQEAVGISRLMNYNCLHNYLEIGGTWIGESYQKTFVNTQAKYLMLSHCFENLACQRIEFRVDSLNFNSQRAVLRLGAKLEGELRQAAVLHDGRKRDYKVYSVLDYEWPNIKKTLAWYLEKYV